MLNELTSHIHPILVHFPIAMIIVGICLDFFQVFKHRSLSASKGVWVWIVAAVGAALAVATGPEQDARGNTTLLDTHQNFADATTWVVFILVAWRIWIMWRGNRGFKRWSLVTYLMLAVASGGLVLATGYYGGMMVYDQGIGVNVHGQAVNPPIHQAWHNHKTTRG